MPRLRQHLALRVLDDDTPRVLLNLDCAIVCAEGNRTTILSPPTGGGGGGLRLEPVTEHHIVSIVVLRHDRCRQHPDAGRPRRNELDGHLQTRVIVIGSIGEVEHLHSHRPVAIEIECLTRRHPVALPLHESFTLGSIEADE